MRVGTSLFAALVLAGALADAARAQVPGVSPAAPGASAAYGPGLSYRQASSYTGPYSIYGPGLTYRQDSSYTGPYSGYGPGLTYRQDSSYTGPYSTRFSSASGPALTRPNSYSSLRPAGLLTQAGNGRGLGGDATRPDAGRVPTTGGGPGVSRPRYVRISIAGNAIQAVVIP